MPTDKEIEEVARNCIDVASGNDDLFNLATAYLSMKADRDEWKAESDINEKKWCDACDERDKAESERDKYKAIVEADTRVLNDFAKRGANPMTQYGYGIDIPWPRLADYIWENANESIALRENKEE